MVLITLKCPKGAGDVSCQAFADNYVFPISEERVAYKGALFLVPDNTVCLFSDDTIVLLPSAVKTMVEFLRWS